MIGNWHWFQSSKFSWLWWLQWPYISNPPKLNLDTKHDGFEHVSPFKYRIFLISMLIFRSVKNMESCLHLIPEAWWWNSIEPLAEKSRMAAGSFFQDGGVDIWYGCFQKSWYPQIIYFNRVFHHKPSILGYPYFWKHPYYVPGSINSDYFHIIGDGHQPNSRGL